MPADLFLDTNILIALLDRTDPVIPFLMEQAEQGAHFATGSVAWHEFVRGPVASGDVDRVAAVLEDRIHPSTREDAELAAFLFRASGSRRSQTSDCLIAASCIRLDASIATRNRRDFVAFQTFGLRISEGEF